MNNSFGAMYAAILFLGATNAATVQPLSPLSVLFSTVKKLLECTQPSLMQSLRLTILNNLLISYFKDKQCLDHNENMSLKWRRWPWKLCTTRYNGVYALIIYSIIGYDWTVAKFLWFYYSMLTSFIFYAIRYDDCGLDTKLSDQWDLHVLLPQSLESLLRFTQTKTGNILHQLT